MFCPNCKQEVTRGAKFCHLCGTPLHDFNMSGDVVAVGGSTVVKAGSVIFGEQNATRIKPCPICGKYNEITTTFLCKNCQSDFICLTHRDAKYLVCSNCMKDVVLRSRPSLIAQKEVVANGYESGLAGWVTKSSPNGFITTAQCSIFSPGYIVEVARTTSDFSFLTAPGASRENTFIEIQIAVKNFGESVYKIPICNTELILKTGEIMKAFRKYKFAEYFGNPWIMFEEFDPVVLNLDGEDISEKRAQLVTLKRDSFTNFYVAFLTDKGISEAQLLNDIEMVVINALGETSGQNMSLHLVSLNQSNTAMNDVV